MRRASRHWRRALAFAAAPLALAAGFFWHRSIPPEYVAHAEVALPGAGEMPGDDPEAAVEELVFSPDVLNAAVELLRERGVLLPLPSPLDSEVDWLLDHARAARDPESSSLVVQLSCSVADRELAVPLLQAIADALVRNQSPAPQSAADPDAERRDAERRQLAEAVARQNAAIETLQAAARPDAPAGAPAEPLQPPEAAQAALDAARRERVDFESRLIETRARLAAGGSIEQVLADLPQQPGWNATHSLIAHARLSRRLHEQQAAIESAQAVYGRKHPRMVELQTQLAQLQEQLAAAGVDAQGTPPLDVPLDELLLRDLERRVAQAVAAEQSAQVQLAAATTRRDEHNRRLAQLAEARQELEFLKGEEARLDQELAAARRVQSARLPGIVEVPTLTQEPLRPGLWKPLGISGTVGLCLSGWFWRSSSVSRKRPHAETAAPRQPRRVRYRSHQEERLAKLKAQSTAPFST
jgi:hypothetical protein